MSMCKLQIHRLFSLRFAAHKLPRLWLWDPTQRFRSPVVDLIVVTRFHQHLIVDLVPVDICRVIRLQNLSYLTRVTHKYSKSHQNMVRVFLLCLEVLGELGLDSKSAKSDFLRFSISRAWSSIDWTSLKIISFSYSLNILETWLEMLWAMSNTYSRHVFVLSLPTYTN